MMPVVLFFLSYYGLNTVIQGGRVIKDDSSLFVNSISSEYSFLINENLLLSLALRDWLHTNISVLLLSERDNFADKVSFQALGKELFFDLYWRTLHLSVGKKIISQGTGYLKNPSNIFLCKDAQDPEDRKNICCGDELAELKVISSAQQSFGLIISRDIKKEQLAVNSLLFDSDLQLLCSRYENERLFGFNASRVFGAVEFHTETIYSWRRKVYWPDNQERDGLVGITGISYGHAGPVFLLVEYLYNGFGYKKEDWEKYVSALERGDSLAISLYQPPFMARNYSFVMIKLQKFTLIPTFHYLQNWEDKSAYLFAGIEYPISQFCLGAELSAFVGNSGDEFGMIPYNFGFTIRTRWSL